MSDDLLMIEEAIAEACRELLAGDVTVADVARYARRLAATHRLKRLQDVERTKGIKSLMWDKT